MPDELLSDDDFINQIHRHAAAAFWSACHLVRNMNFGPTDSRVLFVQGIEVMRGMYELEMAVSEGVDRAVERGMVLLESGAITHQESSILWKSEEAVEFGFLARHSALPIIQDFVDDVAVRGVYQQEAELLKIMGNAASACHYRWPNFVVWRQHWSGGPGYKLDLEDGQRIWKWAESQERIATWAGKMKASLEAPTGKWAQELDLRFHADRIVLQLEREYQAALRVWSGAANPEVASVLPAEAISPTIHDATVLGAFGGKIRTFTQIVDKTSLDRQLVSRALKSLVYQGKLSHKPRGPYTPR